MYYEFVEPNSPRWLSIEDLPNEEWRYIHELDNKYMISNYGRCRSVKKDNPKNQFKGNCILKGYVNRDGYTTFHISLKGQVYLLSAHVYVAKHFIPNPNNYPQVLHKKAVSDGVTNYVNNLYWGTQKDNMRDRRNENKYVVSNENREKISQLFSKPIKQYSLNGELIKTWKSANEASLKLHIDSSSIRKCCRGTQKQTGGFMWRTIDAPDKISMYYRCKPNYNRRRKKVVQFDKNMNYLKLWSSVDDVCKELGIKRNTNLYRVLTGERKTLKGYKWKYYEEVKDELEI